MSHNRFFHSSRIIKLKARNGRTYTMLEQEEQILRQQLMERDLRLQESERRQEVRVEGVIK